MEFYLVLQSALSFSFIFLKQTYHDKHTEITVSAVNRILQV